MQILGELFFANQGPKMGPARLTSFRRGYA